MVLSSLWLFVFAVMESLVHHRGVCAWHSPLPSSPLKYTKTRCRRSWFSYGDITFDKLLCTTLMRRGQGSKCHLALRGPGEISAESASPRADVPTLRAATTAIAGSMVGMHVSKYRSASAQEGAYVPLFSRQYVGFISLNETEPTITDVAYMDIQIGDSEAQRVEISLYGTICPKTVSNFKALCKGVDGTGYKGSQVFRVISTFSIQAGNIGGPHDMRKNTIGRYGSAAGEPFLPENMRILHDSPDGGVVSMMKDISNKGMQDSRFFITLSPTASWADNKYTAFGRVTKGLDFVKSMQALPTVPPTNYPQTPIRIIDSGIV